MAKTTISNFYCVRCGNKGIPVARTNRKIREGGHLKKLYCLHCNQETNHAECRGFGQYDYEDFKIEFENGNFTDDGVRQLPWKQFVSSWRQKNG